MANKSPIFERLIGLETEYALVISRGAAQFQATQGAGARYRIFRQIVAEVGRRVPLVDAHHLKEGVFHASGGAIWHESQFPAAGGGLIEGATPECRSPRQLLAWQRAQDRLLAEAAERAFHGDVRLLKNDRDAQNNIYGAQENYEVEFASGARLWGWRVSLVLILPIVVLTWGLLWGMFVLGKFYNITANLLYLLGSRWWQDPRPLAHFLFGCDWNQPEEECPSGPRWLEATLATATHVIIFPLAAVFYVVLALFAFRNLRRKLTPFLITRPIIAGAGMVDNEGRFLLSDKAPAMNCLTGYGGLLADRPIFSFGNFFKTIHAEAWFHPREYQKLFQPRQRLEIALGDSNRAEVAEYLRIGTTLLVIDAIEAGFVPKPPTIRRPIKVLHAICADPTLLYRIPQGKNSSCTAVELQRSYLEACRAFLEQHDNPPAEAWRLLRLWEETLDALEVDPSDLVGTLDWVTKYFLLEKAGDKASWEVKKKIDLRYHELSSEGYFDRLQASGIAEQMLEPEEIDYALRNPPTSTPATVRGRYIREFAGGDEAIAVNWQQVIIGQGRTARRVDLTRYRAITPPPAKAGSRKPRRKDQN